MKGLCGRWACNWHQRFKSQILSLANNVDHFPPGLNKILCAAVEDNYQIIMNIAYNVLYYVHHCRLCSLLPCHIPIHRGCTTFHLHT